LICSGTYRLGMTDLRISRKLSHQTAMSRLFCIFVILSLVGCNAVPSAVAPAPTTASTATPTTPAPLPTQSPDEEESGPIILEIWVPPAFDPANESPGAELLQARLEEFTQRRSNVRIEMRVKSVEGPGGILDTLTTAGAAAPLALPDLVALPHHALENAAIKGLLHPFDGLTETMNDLDWYEYARQLSHLQNSTFGIPFAGDALVLAYRPSNLVEAPTDWEASLTTSTESNVSISFPAADPNNLVTLAMYQSTGGVILDEENRPILETIHLTEVLTYYQQAQQSSLMPFWLTQYETDEQSWTAFQENRTEMAITWASRVLQNPQTDVDITTIPTSDGIPFTLATGWAWALASPSPDRQVLSAQLAEFLTTPDFLAGWTEASGYLPPRPEALVAWENTSAQSILKLVIPAAQLMPSLDVVTTLGPVLQKATVDILKEQSDPSTLAAEAVGGLSAP
jgi:ABC-type glycerol-3-phosphate transport system substrate-binding protein